MKQVLSTIMAVTILGGAGCAAVEVAPLKGCALPVTTAPPKETDEVRAMLYIHKAGLSIFGIIPAGDTSLRTAMKLLTHTAKELDADAVTDIRYSLRRAPFPIAILWWYRSVTVQGTAVIRK